MKFEVAPLPFAKDALAPHISEQTVQVHYEKHHKGYMRKLKAAIGDTALAKESLEEILCRTEDRDVFNNGAQSPRRSSEASVASTS
jgi:Fe-Mn family superoxide dismutase